MTKDRSSDTRLAVMETDLKYIKNELSTFKEALHSIDLKLDKNLESLPKKFVTRNEFEPIQRIVQGLIAMIVLAVIGALVSGVLI